MPADRLLAEDLLVLCWDDAKGKPYSRCETALPAAVGGALVLDLVFGGAATVDDERLVPGDVTPADPLLTAVRDELAGARRPRKATNAIGSLGSGKRARAVRDRLVAAGVLRAERRRLLGLVPVTRYPLADPGATSVRQTVAELLTGAREPEDAGPRAVALAALAKPTEAVDVLVERDARKAARQRAEAFGEGHGVPEGVGEAVQRAQTAAVAAATAAVTAAAASSAGGAGGGGG